MNGVRVLLASAVVAIPLAVARPSAQQVPVFRAGVDLVTLGATFLLMRWVEDGQKRAAPARS